MHTDSIDESVDLVNYFLSAEIEEDKFQNEKIPGFELGLNKKDGCYFPNYVRNLSLVKTLELRKDDTFVIGYPKSGTTWVEELVWLIKHNADIKTANNKYHFERVLFLDRGIQHEVTDFAPSPRVFKSHLLPQFLPKNFTRETKVVYVIRNPKDMMVSQFNFFKSLSWDPFEGSFKDLFELFLKGKIWYGPWWKHIDSYVKIPNIKIIHYEDLLQNPFEKCKELCKFLDKNLSDAQLETIIEQSSFEKMKQNPAIDFKRLNIFNDSVEFFKSGRIGQWEHYFTDDMSKRLEQAIEQNLEYPRKFNYKMPEIDK